MMPKRKQAQYAALLICAALCTVGRAEILRYDMGTGKSAVAEGWTRLTEGDVYTEQAGIGWVVQSPGVRPRPKLYARDENFSGQRDFLKLGPVLRDHVIAGRNYFGYPSEPYTFRLDTEPGEYVGAVVMVVMTEKSACTINRPPFWWRDYTVTVNGADVAQVERGDIKRQLEDRGKVSETDFLPGMSPFDRGILPHMTVHTFQFDGPTLELSMNTFCPVNALLIAPAAEKAELNKAVSDLLTSAREFVDTQYREAKKDELLEEVLRTAGRKAGLILFPRAMQPLGPYARPTPEEAGRPTGEFVPPGETGILRFGLLPMKPLRIVNIKLDRFSDPDGQTLPEEATSVWLSHLAPMRTVRTGDYYAIRPAYAFPYTPRDLARGVTRQLSIYVKVPADAQPGDYEGRVVVSSPDVAAPVSLKLVVKVLPFRIDPPDIAFGMYWGNPFSTRLRHAWQQMKIPHDLMRELCSEIDYRAFLEMREAGFNTAAFGPARIMRVGDDSQVEIQQDEWQLWCDRVNNYAKVFGRQPLPAYGIGWTGLVSTWSTGGFYGREIDKWRKNGYTDQAIRNMKKLCRRFYAEGKKLNWPEIIFYVQDEMANHGAHGGHMAKTRAELFRKVADEVGFRTCASMNGPVEIPALPYLHIAIPNGALPVTEENLALIKEKGCELWFYNIGSTRYSYGYYLNRTRPTGRLQWSFGGTSRYLDHTAGLPSLGSVNYTLHWNSQRRPGRRENIECMRQGIIDYRYFRTMERLISETSNSNGSAARQAVAEAKKLRDYILNGVKIRNQHSGEDFTSGVWSSSTCQRLRWRLVLAIQTLAQAGK